jgi:hypothetical protein
MLAKTNNIFVGVSSAVENPPDLRNIPYPRKSGWSSHGLDGAGGETVAAEGLK